MSDKILIVDGVATNRILLKVRLGTACHEVAQAGTGEAALALIAAAPPALVILDTALPDMSGIEACRRIRALPLAMRLPVILIGAGIDRDQRLAALQAGADEVLAKPVNETVLLARIRSLLRARRADLDLHLRAETCRDLGLAEAPAPFVRPPQVALIAPDVATAIGWRAALTPHLAGTYRPLAAGTALAEAGAPEGGPGGAPDLYVVAADLAAAGDGLRLVADLRARLGGREAAICLALPRPWEAKAALGLDLGATDLVPLPLDGAETALRLAAALARQRRAEALRRTISTGLQMAATDPLTELRNRRYALAHLDRVAARSLACGTRCAVMVLDLDRFKTVNDRLGHAAGDAVLAAVARRLEQGLRPTDLLARVGGEEFLVVLDDTTPEAARAVAERLCAQVAQSPIALPGGAGTVTVTLSVGLALSPPIRPEGPPTCGGGGTVCPTSADPPAAAPRQPGSPWTSPQDLARWLLAQADAALYAAKDEGRNQVTTASAA